MNLLTSLVLVLPLLVFYEVGVLLTDVVNGADLLTQNLIRWLGIGGFVWFQIGLVALLLVLVIYLRRSQRFELRQFLPVVLESGIYALSMGTFIVFVMVDVLHIDPSLDISIGLAARVAGASTHGIFERLVISAGAGVHEEFLFRLVLLSGFIAILTRIVGMRRWAAVVGGVLLSSILFAVAHHIGPLGDPFRLGVFVYRAMAGVVFALLYHFRSFSIAVYTHTLYDMYVLLLA